MKASKRPHGLDRDTDYRKRLGSKQFYDKYNNPDSKSKGPNKDMNEYQGTYDSYKARNSDLFRNRMNEIMEGVNQRNEESEKNIMVEHKTETRQRNFEKRDTYDMVDFLELNVDDEANDKQKGQKKTKEPEKDIDLLDLNF